jgi:hypothetical protein
MIRKLIVGYRLAEFTNRLRPESIQLRHLRKIEFRRSPPLKLSGARETSREQSCP